MLPKQTEKICDEIINRKIDVYWACETRADKLSISLVKKMKKAGCTRIQVGIETGDPELLETIGKRRSTLKTIEESLQVIQNEGLLMEANFLVGLPGESWKTIQNTAKLIKRIRPDDVSVSIVTPYPGTPLFEMAKREGWLITDDWKNFSTSTPVMKLPTFSDRDMKEAQRYIRYVAISNAALKNIAIAIKKRQFGFALKNSIQNLPVFGINLYFAVKFKSHFILS
jgi:anaerobic magnesium-protoporphyrin IX monomethyl ester cyclase